MSARYLRFIFLLFIGAAVVPAAASSIQPDSLRTQERVSLSQAQAARSPAQERACPPECPWEGVLNYAYADVSDGRAPWHEVRASIFHSLGVGSLGLELIEGSRFERWDRAAALDSYAELWEGSYGNLRIQYAPSPAFMPDFEVYGEVFQSIPGAWEVSANYRLRTYPGDQIHLFGVSAGRYIGSWMVRGLGQILPRAGEIGGVYAVEARRYFEPPRSFLELEAGVGRGVEVIAAGPVIQTTETYYAVARLQKYVTPHVGFAIQGAYSDDDFFTRRTLGAGLMVRW